MSEKSGVTWQKFFETLLELRTPEEIEKGLRESFDDGELDDLTKEDLEHRLAQMRQIAASRKSA